MSTTPRVWRVGSLRALVHTTLALSAKGKRPPPSGRSLGCFSWWCYHPPPRALVATLRAESRDPDRCWPSFISSFRTEWTENRVDSALRSALAALHPPFSSGNLIVLTSSLL